MGGDGTETDRGQVGMGVISPLAGVFQQHMQFI